MYVASVGEQQSTRKMVFPLWLILVYFCKHQGHCPTLSMVSPLFQSLGFERGVGLEWGGGGMACISD